jgi:hypothetical protein
MDDDVAQQDKAAGHNHHGRNIACLDFGSRTVAANLS